MTDHTRSRRPGGALLLAALVLAAAAVSSAATAALSEPPPVPAAQELRAEIEAMVASGVDPNDPKITMLEEQLAELEAGARTRPPRERGVDVAATLEAARAAERAEDARVATRSTDAGASATAEATAGEPPAWESGAVLCEVVPGLLGPEEIAGAVCASVPQPDGTSRYVAVGRDGTVRAVAFGHDGSVRRVPDTPGRLRAARGVRAAATREGDLVLTPSGGAAVTVDLR
jgi:hypothetical protein